MEEQCLKRASPLRDTLEGHSLERLHSLEWPHSLEGHFLEDHSLEVLSLEGSERAPPLRDTGLSLERHSLKSLSLE